MLRCDMLLNNKEFIGKIRPHRFQGGFASGANGLAIGSWRRHPFRMKPQHRDRWIAGLYVRALKISEVAAEVVRKSPERELVTTGNPPPWKIRHCRFRLFAGRAGVHVDFHANRHFNDFWSLPGHFGLSLSNGTAGCHPVKRIEPHLRLRKRASARPRLRTTAPVGVGFAQASAASLLDANRRTQSRTATPSQQPKSR
jgi:hypothetical protein